MLIILGQLSTAVGGFGLTCGAKGIGCPNSTPDSVFGTDEEMMTIILNNGDQYSMYVQDPPNFPTAAEMNENNDTTVLATFGQGMVAAFMMPFGKGAFAFITPHPEADQSWGAGVIDTTAYKAGQYVAQQLLAKYDTNTFGYTHSSGGKFNWMVFLFALVGCLIVIFAAVRYFRGRFPHLKPNTHIDILKCL